MARTTRSGKHTSGGFTLLEVLMVAVIVGIMASIVAPNFRRMSNDLLNGAREAASFLRLARAQAIATTSAYRLKAVSTLEFQGEYARRCDDDESEWVADSRVRWELREGLQVGGGGIAPDSVIVCYDSRGQANASPTLVLVDRYGTSARLDVFLGGTVRVILDEEE